jgi:hypothetical protein
VAPASITYPSPGNSTVPIPSTASSCIITEGRIPLAPRNWLDPMFYKGSADPANVIAGTGFQRRVDLNPSGNTLIIVANRFS